MAFGLYRSTADFGAELPRPIIDFVMLQPSGTAVGFSVTQNFGSFSPAPGQFPSNAIGELVTWTFDGSQLELRMLRPLFVPTGVAAPSQIYAGYLRGRARLAPCDNGSYQGTMDIEVVQIVGAGTCLNGLTSMPCVTRTYSGTINLAAMDPWDQPDQPHVVPSRM